jgi:hypothetical protein
MPITAAIVARSYSERNPLALLSKSERLACVHATLAMDDA